MITNNTGWALLFKDERDFLQYASQIIGATYASSPDAIERIVKGAADSHHHGPVQAGKLIHAGWQVEDQETGIWYPIDEESALVLTPGRCRKVFAAA